ncbi:MAG: hypothetical protein ACK5Y2_13345 [Bdellovibrionales bacterium]
MKSRLQLGIAVLGLILNFADFAQASEPRLAMSCEVLERRGSASRTEIHDLRETDDPHGDIQYFNLNLFPDLTVLLSHIRGVAVIHVYDPKTGFGSTTQGDMTGTGTAFHQVLLPSDSVDEINFIQIFCRRPQP